MKKKRLLLTGVAALLALLFVGAAWWNSRLTYRRYISQPLQDGTQYTFLFPARMTSVATYGDSVFMVDKSSPSSPLTWASIKLLFSGRRLANNAPHDSIEVAVAHEKVPKDDRCCDEGDSYLTISDKRSQTTFNITFYDHNEAQSKTETRTVFRSFRILPPGAPVPSP